MLAAAATVLLSLQPLTATPPISAILDPLPYVTWRTRYVLDGREVDATELDAAIHRLIELQVEGRRVRVAVFERRLAP